MDRKNLGRTADVVAAHVSNNPVAAGQLPQLIDSIYRTFAQLGASPPGSERTPAVPIASSVTKAAIVCLECGGKFKSLKRHLLGRHGLTPDDYRQRWDLANHYPMVTRGYSAQRAELARQNGLGRKPGRGAGPVTEPATEPAFEPASGQASQTREDVMAGDASTPSLAPGQGLETSQDITEEVTLGDGPDSAAGPARIVETDPAALQGPHAPSLPA
ncbi:MucR family transcriptional regulator [Novosphingobium sp. AP12]|uniref:MucR family transcriptional regulator n=1 Tax=Novosphingobium sp. AP12 TaxID=1144305 RepID=UPI0002E3B54F|nr:MucR family transcriptional regulator [Novosphingobium sp. AP12]